MRVAERVEDEVYKKQRLRQQSLFTRMTLIIRP